jgi:electron transport complex protein RnfB
MVMTGLAAVAGIALCLAEMRVPAKQQSLVDNLNNLLPQTQCGQCGYPGCRPYAQAILDGAAELDQCAPGGASTISAIANLLGQTAKTLNPEFGQYTRPAVAVIDEKECIGCTLCISACPVDAIVGAAQFSHTILRQECTGCELCIAPCPVDCITMVSPLTPGAR